MTFQITLIILISRMVIFYYIRILTSHTGIANLKACKQMSCFYLFFTVSIFMVIMSLSEYHLSDTFITEL